MKLAVFGATGRTGQHLVRQALDQGHAVVALARTPSRLGLTHDRLTVVQGDILNAEAVQAVVSGADAVISTLGPTANKPDFTVSRGMEIIIAAMQAAGVRRLILSAGAGVGDPNDQPKLVNHAISYVLRLVSRHVVADMEQAVERVRASGLDWTIVRVPMLTDAPATGAIREGWVGVNTGARLSRSDMADYMLRQIAGQHIRQAPMISN